MRLLWLSTLVVSFVTAALDVERTVRQVQIILETNTQLPRLSREEILQLLNDIRAEDAKSKSLSTERSVETFKATTSFFSYDGNEKDSEKNLKTTTAFFSYDGNEKSLEKNLKPTTSYFSFDGNEKKSAEKSKPTTSYFSYDGNKKNSAENYEPATSDFNYYGNKNLLSNNRKPTSSYINDRNKQHTTEGIKTTTSYFSYDGNEINPTETYDNVAANGKDNTVTVTPPNAIETTTKAEPSLMVVLPYTPRDGSSLQELFTRPPRTEVLPESKASPKPFTLNANHKLHDALQNNAKLASNINKNVENFPADLQAFLDAHGLKGKPGQDHFLLPLDGFKPLPPAKIVDGSVQLPENILLSYDLIAPSAWGQIPNDAPKHSNDLVTGFLYEPLRPEFPFELQTSSSETKKSVLPLDMPKRQRKSPTTKKPSYAPIDYDSIRVIPLNKGPNPFDDSKFDLSNELSKRQTNDTVQSQISITVNASTTTNTSTEETKNAITNAPPSSDSVGSDTDAGASIADLEDSFGGAAPEQPGDSELPPPRKNGFYWMVDWNSFLEVGDGDTKVNIRFEPKLGDPQMFLPVNVP